MSWKTPVVAVLTALVLVAVLAPGTLAKKPVKPPPTPTASGTIYYIEDGVLHSMAPDGGSKAELGAAVTSPPSIALHGGKRWFLEARTVAGDPYPDDLDSPRQELFAVREDGTTFIQLTNDPSLQPNVRGGAAPRWMTVGSTADGAVSYLALRWSADGTVAEWGIYTLALDPAAVANGTHDATAPTRVAVDVDLRSQYDEVTKTTTYYLNSRYTWSPDASSLVYVINPSELWKATRSGDTWSETLLLDGGTAPSWSPDGGRIAYYTGGTLRAMDPDGSNDSLVASAPSGNKNSWYAISGCAWSPSGTQLAYLRQKFTTRTILATDRDVIRVDADGSDDESLTGDVKAYCIPLGWRGE